MGAGRPPRAIKDNTVSHRTKKEIEARDKSTPVYESQEFVPPEDLTAKELEVWNWLVKIFRETRNCMVSDADVHLMQMYCRAKVETDTADKELKKDNRAYIIIALGKDKKGNIKTTAKINPNIKRRHDNALLCLKLFDQLGLSPLARARVGCSAANADKEISEFAELMNRSDD